LRLDRSSLKDFNMHLGNGAITPECAALGFAAAAVGVGYSGFLASRERQRPASLIKAAALGSLVFAAQMLNVPVLEHSSAHFVGGVLLAELLGPALGVLTMSLVLLLQALALGDGGTAALGLNIVNMALVPAGLSAVARRCSANRHLAMPAAAALSVALGILLISGEVAMGRQLSSWSTFVSALAMNHLPLLGLEALLTVAIAAAWRRLESGNKQPTLRLAGATAVAALLVVAVAMTCSSALPDGYEAAAISARMEWLLTSSQ
jgi:cobalt/nickel transport system permease protein